jgi:hypothetical protein
MRSTLSLICGVVALASAFALIPSSVQAQDNVAVFMRAKLNHSQQVLKGLATEDYDLIAKHSQAMSLLCEDELWSVLQTPEYRARSAEFQRSVDAVTEAARKKNLEAAALGYVDVTLKCVNCHKYVRKVRMARLEEFPQLRLSETPK